MVGWGIRESLDIRSGIPIHVMMPDMGVYTDLIGLGSCDRDTCPYRHVPHAQYKTEDENKNTHAANTAAASSSVCVPTRPNPGGYLELVCGIPSASRLNPFHLWG